MHFHRSDIVCWHCRVTLCDDTVRWHYSDIGDTCSSRKQSHTQSANHNICYTHRRLETRRLCQLIEWTNRHSSEKMSRKVPNHSESRVLHSIKQADTTCFIPHFSRFPVIHSPQHAMINSIQPFLCSNTEIQLYQTKQKMKKLKFYFNQAEPSLPQP